MCVGMCACIHDMYMCMHALCVRVCVCAYVANMLCSVTCSTHIIVAGMPTRIASPTGTSAPLKAATSSTCNCTTEGERY